jgi:methanethiol S-methyltransferase
MTQMTETHPGAGPIGRALALAGGGVFVAALGTFAACYAWVYGADAGPWTRATAVQAVAIDLALFSVFALHHSVFARTGLKTWVATVVDRCMERSTYVWIASLMFLAVLVFWQPVGGTLWRVDGPTRYALWTLQAIGVLITIRASGQIDPLDLAGIRQAFGQRTTRPQELSRRGLYGLVRHPIYLGWILIVWPTPVMTGTRLVFAAVSTVYLMIAIPFEERSLVKTFGEEYRDYARQVRARMIPFLY